MSIFIHVVKQILSIPCNIHVFLKILCKSDCLFHTLSCYIDILKRTPSQSRSSFGLLQHFILFLFIKPSRIISLGDTNVPQQCDNSARVFIISPTTSICFNHWNSSMGKGDCSTSGVSREILCNAQNRYFAVRGYIVIVKPPEYS